MAEGYARLLKSIINSSIWQEDDQTLRVWVAMLALANDDGYVGASLSGLARQARVPTDKTKTALAKFMAPDDDSRSPEHDGRRIELAERGWRILNYRKFSEMPAEVQQVSKAGGNQRPPVPCPPDLLAKLDAIGEVEKLAVRHAVDRLDIVAAVQEFVDYWTSPERDDINRVSATWFTRVRGRIATQAHQGFLRGLGHNLIPDKRSGKAVDLIESQRAKVEKLGGKA